MFWNIATVFVLLAGITFLTYVCAIHSMKLKGGGMIPIVCLSATTVFQAAFVVALFIRHEPIGNIIPAFIMLAVVAAITLNDIIKRDTPHSSK